LSCQKTIILQEAHVINKNITQATQNNKKISKSIKRFFTRFHISLALKTSNAYKKKGISVTEIFRYLFLLIFSDRSMYMNLITVRNTPAFAKDMVYRFMKMIQIGFPCGKSFGFLVDRLFNGIIQSPL